MKKIITLLIGVFVVSTAYSQDNLNSNTEKIVSSISKDISLKEIVKPYVTDLLESSKKGVKWAAKEVPSVVKQYIAFEACKRGFYIFLGIGFITFFRYFTENLILTKSETEPEINTKDGDRYVEIRKNRWLLKNLKRDYDERIITTPQEEFFAVVRHLYPIIGIVIILCYIVNFIKIVFFPKLFLVQEFFNLFNNN